nr:ABC transporter permease [Burkholderia stagnalis]
MKLPYEWQVGLRYTRAGKRSTGNGFISFIAAVSMAGIALGVAALIIVLSVMNGFRSEVRDRMLSVLAHVEIFSPTGTMPDWVRTAEEALRNPSVKAAAPYARPRRCSRTAARSPASRCAASIRGSSRASPTSRRT